MQKTLLSGFELQSSGQMLAACFFKDFDKCSRNLDKWLPSIMKEGATSKPVRRPLLSTSHELSVVRFRSSPSNTPRCLVVQVPVVVQVGDATRSCLSGCLRRLVW